MEKNSINCGNSEIGKIIIWIGYIVCILGVLGGIGCLLYGIFEEEMFALIGAIVLVVSFIVSVFIIGFGTIIEELKKSNAMLKSICDKEENMSSLASDSGRVNEFFSDLPEI